MRLRLLATFVISLLLAGCGSSGPKSNGEASKTAEQIVSDAIAAAESATSVHVAGSGLNAGKPLALDLHLVAGKGGKGRLSASGLTFQVIRIGPKAYFSGDATFWRNFGGGPAAQLLRGRWLAASSLTGNFASFTPLTDVKKLFGAMLGTHGALQKGKTTTIDGRPAIAVVDTQKGGTLYVATTGPPYPLEVKSQKQGSFKFDQWNQPVALTAPKGAIDFAKLKG